MEKLSKVNNKCFGCFACFNICPAQAIKMEINNEGFFYPVIDKEKCIHCGLCEKVCPVLNKLKNNNIFPQFIYAAWSNNKDILMSSSSGGLFTELANYILDKSGEVYGVVYENNRTKHICIKNKNDLKIIRGSKYLQSNIGFSFKNIYKSLLNNKKILFCGTPCQVAGLNAFLKINNCNTNNLYTIDLVCHGVPSYKIFDDYLKYKFKNKTINHIDFRKKLFNWSDFYILYFLKEKIKFIYHKKDIFFRGYLKNYYLRESCYNCKFAQIPRQGDITLGDFWGIPKKYCNHGGVSLVLLNNKEGGYLFNKILNKITIKKLNIESKFINNPRLFSGKYNDLEKRSLFFKDYLNYGFEYIYKKYLKLKLRKKIILKIKIIIKFIKTIL